MSSDARRRAEACFRVARSSTFEGERTNAVERGIAIATAAGLSLDSFDIPGRSRPRAVFDEFDLFAPTSDLEEVLRAFESSIRESPFRARERRVEEALRRERARRSGR